MLSVTKATIATIFIILLTACGGGSGNNETTAPAEPATPSNSHNNSGTGGNGDAVDSNNHAPDTPGTTVPPSSSSTDEDSLPKIQLTVENHTIQAELAVDKAERKEGLMFRSELGESEGMLFVFPGPEGACMWMKNTYIPLSVAFLDESGAIINIEDMQPKTTETHCAAEPAHYALEMNQGWFEKRNITPGNVIEGLPK